jgi:hypothetical protein
VGCFVAVGLLVPTAGQAQAACVWQRTELRVPEFHVGTEVWGVGGEYAVGTTQNQGVKGIRWHNGQGTLLGVPSVDPNSTAEPRDVNSSGVVTGTLQTRRPDETVSYDAYIMRLDGSYQLMGSTTHQEWAVAINDRGDVAGYTYGDGVVKTIVWWATDYSKYEVITSGTPVGISDSGKVVTSQGLMVSKLSSGLFAGRRLAKPAGAEQIVVGSFDNSTPVGWSVSSGGSQAIVWNANGSIRSVTPGFGYVGNNLGTVIGIRSGGVPTLWRNVTVDTLPAPAPRMIPGRVFIDNRDVISGTYVGPGNEAGAAQWRCS